MGKLDMHSYADVIRASGFEARALAGGFVARFYPAMIGLATISMYSQSGYSYSQGGIAASAIALSIFLIAPRVSKRIDRLGQSRVIPKAMAIGLAGLAAMLLSVHLRAPYAVSLALSVLLGFFPIVPSIMRTRWTYLLNARGAYTPARLSTAFSFEGILDDCAFMISPAIAIAFSSWFFPEAGLVLGGACYAVGMSLVLSAKGSEPDIAFMRGEAAGSQAGGGAGTGAAAGTGAGAGAPGGGILRACPAIAPLFAMMFLAGMSYGFVEPATYALCNQLAEPTTASLVFALSSVFSCSAGVFYGMVKFTSPMRRRMLAISVFYGIAYGFMVGVTNIPLLFAAHIVGALSWAPFVITVNTSTESVVGADRVTEGLTLVNTGLSLGMVFGPSLGGIVVDTLGVHPAFVVAGVESLLVPVVFACSRRLFSKPADD